MIPVEHVALSYMRETRNECRMLVRKLEGPRSRWEDDIKLNIREVGCESMGNGVQIDTNTLQE
jgi:hypothetical protein